MNQFENSVSVIAPGYNVAHFILRRLKSITAQTIRPHEVIFVDDFSSDSTRQDVAKFFEDARIILNVASNEVNTGQGTHEIWVHH